MSKLCKNDMAIKDLVIKHLKECIEQIRYLFKSDKYSYEEQFRLIVYSQVDSNDVKINDLSLPVPELYIEKDDGKPLEITKIILGPKVAEPSKIVPYIKYVNPKIKVVKSNVEFR